ncbi:MAG: hypothetical protein Q4G65_12750 [bacterium]|nr:hypothetical protein [bacterium]
MKRQLVGFMCGVLAVLVTSSTAWAKTVTWTVAAGETKTFTDMVNGGEDVVAGDTIIKKGPGILKVDSAHKIKCTVTVEEGVFHVTELVMGDGGTVTVKKGACLYVSGSTGQMLKSWTYNVEGEGTGTDPYLGAIVVNGSNGNGQLVYGTFNLTDDATFYTCKGIINYMFSGNSNKSGPTLNMDSHTLTLKGPDTSAKFRARWALNISKSGPIVVDGMVYSRHANSASTMDVYTPNIPVMKMVNGAIVSLDGYYFEKVNAFDAAAGTSFGYSSETTPKLGTAGAFKGTVQKVIGCPNVLSDTVLTIDKAFVVRGSDLAAGNKLSSVNALTFTDGCTLDVTELGELDYTPGTVYTVAESQTSVVGTPTLVGDAANLFTVANTGTAITITAKPNAGGVFLPGEENAAANTATLATFCANATDGMNVLLSKGDYYFTEDFDLSAMTAKNVRIQSIDNAATIHAALKLGAAEAVTVSKVNFMGTAGPAVVANGTAGLTIADCKLTDVAGAWTDDKKYPYAVTGVTDFELLRPTYAFTGDDKHPWNGAAFFDGGTQTEKSQARTGEWVVFIDPNATDTGGATGWAGLDYVTNKNGLAASAYNGLKLRKTGGGTFDPGNALSLVGVAGVEIVEGQYVERGDDHLGVAKGAVTVKNGANLTIAGGGKSIDQRTVYIEGTGIKADQPAVRFTGSSSWNKAPNITWNLTGDATMYDNIGNDGNGSFLWSTFVMNDHVLTLTGKAGGVFRIGRWCTWSGGGQMVVSGVKLSSTPSSNTVKAPSKTAFSYKDGKRPKFVFQNEGGKAAIFAPESCEIQYLVTDIDFATDGCQFTPGVNTDAKDLPHALAFSFDRFAGAPEIGTNLESLTIENNYTIHVAQLKAGKPLTLPCPLTFKDGATVTLDDLSAYEKPVKTLFATASEINGKPKPDAAAAEAGWRVTKEKNATGTVSLYLGPISSLMIIVR